MMHRSRIRLRKDERMGETPARCRWEEGTRCPLACKRTDRRARQICGKARTRGGRRL